MKKDINVSNKKNLYILLSLYNTLHREETCRLFFSKFGRNKTSIIRKPM